MHNKVKYNFDAEPGFLEPRTMGSKVYAFQCINFFTYIKIKWNEGLQS